MAIPTNLIPDNISQVSASLQNSINNIDEIKRNRQQASIKSLKDELKRQENPFTYRQSLKNQQTQTTVLGRYNNQ
jgi:hypothetical protein